MKSTHDALVALKDQPGMLLPKHAIAHVLPPSSTPEPENALSALMKSLSGMDTLVLLAPLELTTTLNLRPALFVLKVLFTMLEKEPALLHDYSSWFLIISHNY
jgi:hypothetical protein